MAVSVARRMMYKHEMGGKKKKKKRGSLEYEGAAFALSARHEERVPDVWVVSQDKPGSDCVNSGVDKGRRCN